MPLQQTRDAKDAANYASTNLFKVHRGVMKWSGPSLALFGNDGYEQDELTRHQVEILLAKFQLRKIRMQGFGLSDDGCSWAALIKIKDQPAGQAGTDVRFARLACFLEDILWDAWRESRGILNGKITRYEALERSVADRTLIGNHPTR